MRIGLIDVIDWQARVDFKSGRPVNIKHPMLDMAGEVLRKHPYPGDLSAGGVSRWVTDTAQDIQNRYLPDLMVLSYAGIYFSSAFSPPSEAHRTALIRETFDDIQRFLDVSGFKPVIVGLGDMTTQKGFIDTTGLNGLVISGGMSARYAGLYGPTPHDLMSMFNHPEIEHLIDRDTFRAQFGGIPEFYRRFPDYLVAASEGFIFRGVGSSARTIHCVPRFDQFLPLHTSLNTSAPSITDISDLVLEGLQGGGKVALILVEGVGCASFPLQFHPISNTCHWHSYTVGEGQYLTLTSGQHFIERPYPPGCPYYLDNDENQPYPFSGIFNEMPPQTVGQRYTGKSAAVGSRSILTHLAAGTDITIECFARELYNHGVMAMVNLPDEDSGDSVVS